MASNSYEKVIAGTSIKSTGDNLNSLAVSNLANYFSLADSNLNSKFILQSLNLQNPEYPVTSIPVPRVGPERITIEEGRPRNFVFLQTKVPMSNQQMIAPHRTKFPGDNRDLVPNFNAETLGNRLYYDKSSDNFNSQRVLNTNNFELLEFGGNAVLTNPAITVSDIQEYGLSSSKQVVGTELNSANGNSDISSDSYNVLKTPYQSQGNQGTLESNIAFRTYTATDFKPRGGPLPVLGAAVQIRNVRKDKQVNYTGALNSALLGNQLTWQALGFSPQVYIVASTLTLTGFVGYDGGSFTLLNAGEGPGRLFYGPTGLPERGVPPLPREIVGVYTDFDTLGVPPKDDFYLYLKGTTDPAFQNIIGVRFSFENGDSKETFKELFFADAISNSAFGSNWRIRWDDILFARELWISGNTYGVALITR